MADQASLQSLFDSAQNKLVAKDFAAARDFLLKIKEQGFSSASVEAALGRAFLETGDGGKAIVAWQNAVALDRWNSTYRSDLSLAQSKVASGAGTRMEHPSEVANTIASYVRAPEQFFIGSALVLILIWLYLAGVLQKVKKLSRVFVGLGVLLVFACAIFSLSSRSLAVLVDKTSLKPAPLDSADGSLEIAAGTRVRILQSSGNFVEIERPNGFRGWVKSELLSRSPY